MKYPFLVLFTVATLVAQEGIALEASAFQNAPLQRRPPPQRLADGSGANSGRPSAMVGSTSFPGTPVLFSDPSNSVRWDGKSWSVTNNTLFASRFVKYLNAPPAVDQEYGAYFQQIIVKLSPGGVTSKSTEEALGLLAKASGCQQDANLCDTIANQVYSAYTSRRDIERLWTASRLLEDEMKRLEWNAQMTTQGNEFDRGSKQLGPAMEVQSIITKITEIKGRIRANQLRREVAELRSRIEFQALIMQHFFQRRFQHVLIGIRFYRSIFTDGGRLRLKNVKTLLSEIPGRSPTLNTIDSLVKEVISEVRESVQVFKFLLEKKELVGATRRLSEAFMIGEHLPEVRAISSVEKRRVLTFVQKSDQLSNTIEAKDFGLARNLVTELSQTAKDFDVSKPLAAIETARQISAVHIAKVRNAAVSGDKKTLEAELTAAMEVWPRNPALAEISTMIFSHSDVESQALVDFDQLLSRKDYRQIFDDKMRFIAATAMHPDKQKQLCEVLECIETIETSIVQARQIEKRGNYAAAWETAEKAFRNFPDDNRLNRVRADLTTKAADFVHALRQAQELENKNQYGSSFAWYLKARKKYPESEFARQGIDRLTRQILPDAG